MKKFTVSILVGLMFAPSLLCAEDPQPSLTSTEILQVERICIQLIGSDSRQWDRLWQKLRPFARDPNEFDNRVIICSAGCQGGVAMRGGYGVSASGPNEPSGTAAYRKKTNVVTSVVFTHNNHIILSLGATSDDPSSVWVATSRKELLARLSASKQADKAAGSR